MSNRIVDWFKMLFIPDHITALWLSANMRLTILQVCLCSGGRVPLEYLPKF